MFLGLDLSQDNAAAILANERGESQIALRAALPKDGGSPAIWTSALNLARDAMQRAQIAPERVLAAGLSMDVPFDARGVITRGARSDGWEGFDAPNSLREHLGIARAVASTRAFCAARGEARYGVLRPNSEDALHHQNQSGETANARAVNQANFAASTRANGDEVPPNANWLYLHLDWQLGAAACLNGEMLRGETNRALDFGAICLDRDGPLGINGNRGSLEAFCGGESFVARAAGYGITVRAPLEVWEMASQNYAARALCEDYSRRLAQGIGIALALLDVRRVVLGGTIPDALGETLLAPLRLALTEFRRAPQGETLLLESAQLGGDAAVLGAIDLAIAAAPRATTRDA